MKDALEECQRLGIRLTARQRKLIRLAGKSQLKGPDAGRYLWRGQLYIGQDAVAEAAGCHRSTVTYHLNKYGNLDRLGVGRGKHEGHKARCRPMRVGGQYFASAAEFGRKVGLARSTVNRMVNAGRYDTLLAYLMRSENKG